MMLTYYNAVVETVVAGIYLKEQKTCSELLAHGY